MSINGINFNSNPYQNSYQQGGQVSSLFGGGGNDYFMQMLMQMFQQMFGGTLTGGGGDTTVKPGVVGDTFTPLSLSSLHSSAKKYDRESNGGNADGKISAEEAYAASSELTDTNPNMARFFEILGEKLENGEIGDETGNITFDADLTKIGYQGSELEAMARSSGNSKEVSELDLKFYGLDQSDFMSIDIEDFQDTALTLKKELGLSNNQKLTEDEARTISEHLLLQNDDPDSDEYSLAIIFTKLADAIGNKLVGSGNGNSRSFNLNSLSDNGDLAKLAAKGGDTDGVIDINDFDALYQSA